MMAIKYWDIPPPMSIDPQKRYRVRMETGKGAITLELYPQHAPKTVNNFVFLAREGFYDGVSFHRVIGDFMIQGGDPTGSGRGGPGYRVEDEVAGNPLAHEGGGNAVGAGGGVASMADPGPKQNGNQILLPAVAPPPLKGKAHGFGRS